MVQEEQKQGVEDQNGSSQGKGRVFKKIIDRKDSPRSPGGAYLLLSIFLQEENANAQNQHNAPVFDKKRIVPQNNICFDFEAKKVPEANITTIHSPACA